MFMDFGPERDVLSAQGHALGTLKGLFIRLIIIGNEPSRHVQNPNRRPAPGHGPGLTERPLQGRKPKRQNNCRPYFITTTAFGLRAAATAFHAIGPTDAKIITNATLSMCFTTVNCSPKIGRNSGLMMSIR